MSASGPSRRPSSISPCKAVEVGDVVAAEGEDHDVATEAELGRPVRDQLLLGAVGRVADVDATVSVVRGEEATHLAGAQVGERDTFPGVTLSAVLGEPDCRHPLLEAAQHAAGFDRLELMGITDQDES